MTLMFTQAIRSVVCWPDGKFFNNINWRNFGLCKPKQWCLVRRCHLWLTLLRMWFNDFYMNVSSLNKFEANVFVNLFLFYPEFICLVLRWILFVFKHVVLPVNFGWLVDCWLNVQWNFYHLCFGVNSGTLKSDLQIFKDVFVCATLSITGSSYLSHITISCIVIAHCAFSELMVFLLSLTFVTLWN